MALKVEVLIGVGSILVYCGFQGLVIRDSYFHVHEGQFPVLTFFCGEVDVRFKLIDLLKNVLVLPFLENNECIFHVLQPDPGLDPL